MLRITYPKSGTSPSSPHPALLSTLLTPVTATHPELPWPSHKHLHSEHTGHHTIDTHRQTYSIVVLFFFSYFSPLGSWLLQNVFSIPRAPAMPDNLSHFQIPVALCATTSYHILHLSCHLQSHVMSKHPISPNRILCPRPTFPKRAATTWKNPRKLCLQD